MSYELKSDVWDPSSRCTTDLADHNIDDALIESQRWIESVTDKKFANDDFRASLENGVLLCELVTAIKPGSIKKINRLPTPYAGLDNLNLFLHVCEDLGLSGSQLFDTCDLQDITNRGRKLRRIPKETKKEAERRLKNVCSTLYWLGKAAHSLPKYRGPQLNLRAFEQLLWPSNLSKESWSKTETSVKLKKSHSLEDILDTTDSLNNNVSKPKMDAYRNRYSGNYSDYNYSRENGYGNDISSHERKNPDEFVPSETQKRNDNFGYRRPSMPGGLSKEQATKFIAPEVPQHFRFSSGEDVKVARPSKELLEEQKKKNNEDQSAWMSSLSTWKQRRISATHTERERKAEREQYEEGNNNDSNRRSSIKPFHQIVEERLRKKDDDFISILDKPVKEVSEDRALLDEILTSVTLEDDGSVHGSQRSEEEREEAYRRYMYQYYDNRNPTSGYSSRPWQPYPPQPAVHRWNSPHDEAALYTQAARQPPPVMPRRTKPYHKTASIPLEKPVIMTADETVRERTPPDRPGRPAIIKATEIPAQRRPEPRTRFDNERFGRQQEQPRSTRSQPLENRNIDEYSQPSGRHEQPISNERQQPVENRYIDAKPMYRRDEPSSPPSRNRYNDDHIRHRPREEYRGDVPPAESYERRDKPKKEPPPVARRPKSKDVVDLSSLKQAEKKRLSSGILDRVAVFNDGGNQAHNSKPDNRSKSAFNEMTICINQRPHNEKGFGFVMSGGIDKNKPLYVEKVALGGSADICELCAGDEIIFINNQNAVSFTHDAALNAVSQAVVTGNLQLKIRRYGNRGPDESKPSNMKVHIPTVEETRLPENNVPITRTTHEKVEKVMEPEINTLVSKAWEPEPYIPKAWEPQPYVNRTREPEPVVLKKEEPAPKKKERERFITRSGDRSKNNVAEKPIEIKTEVEVKAPAPEKHFASDDEDLLFLEEGDDSGGDMSPAEEERIEREILEQLEREEEEERKRDEMHKQIEAEENKSDSDEDKPPPPIPSRPPPLINLMLRPRREKSKDLVKLEIWKRRHNFFRHHPDKSCWPVFRYSDEEIIIETPVTKETVDVADDVEALWQQVEKISSPGKITNGNSEELQKQEDLFAGIEKPPPITQSVKKFDIKEEQSRLEKWQLEQDKLRQDKYVAERKQLRYQYELQLEKIHDAELKRREAEALQLERYEQELLRTTGYNAEETAKRRELFMNESARREEEYKRRKEELQAFYKQDQQRLEEKEIIETQEDNLKHEESKWELEKDHEEGKKQEIEVKKKHIERERRRTQELDVEAIRLEAEARLKKEWEELEKEKQMQQERERLAMSKLEEIRREHDRLMHQRDDLERKQQEEIKQLMAERKKLHTSPPPSNLTSKDMYTEFAAIKRNDGGGDDPTIRSRQQKPTKSALKQPKHEESVQEQEKRKAAGLPLNNLAKKSDYLKFAAIQHENEEPEDNMQKYRLQSQPMTQPKKIYQPETHSHLAPAKIDKPASYVSPLQKASPFDTQSPVTTDPNFRKYFQQPVRETPQQHIPERDTDYSKHPGRGRDPSPSWQPRRDDRRHDPVPAVMSKYKDESATPSQHWMVEEAERRRLAEREGYDRGTPYEAPSLRHTSTTEKPQRDIPPPTEMRYDERYMYAPPERDTAQKPYGRYEPEQPVKLRQQRETEAERQQKLANRRTHGYIDRPNLNTNRRQRSMDDTDKYRRNRHSMHELGSYSNSAENLPLGAVRNQAPLPDAGIHSHRTASRGSGSPKVPPSPQKTGAYPYPPLPLQAPPTMQPPAPAPIKPGGQSQGNRSVSGKVLCTRCGQVLGRGAAMIIESLGLHFHISCFKCCVCNCQLGSGAKGTDVRIRASKLHCQNCYSNDAGFEFTEV
ncbi:uncharacterized protein LOC100366345 [Saccoglossus kowalevskii]